jgi:tetratricopeptide (TPR) repeat protein
MKMSPQSIFLYEIDKSFGPNLLAEYSLTNLKVQKDILKEFIEKHVNKEFNFASVKKDNIRYYSGKIEGLGEGIDNVYLGFIFKDDEDILSIKSAFETILERVRRDYSKDKNELVNTLKDSLNSILTLMDKLKEPRIIVDTINEKTKKMLDDGKLQEARELIELGEKIPENLAEEIKLAEQYLNEHFYKKAKKSYEKSAGLAESIQEYEIASFLKHKAEEVGLFPDLKREQEQLLKEIGKNIEDLQSNQLHLYHEIIKPLNRLIELSSSFEEQEKISRLLELITKATRADRLAKELFNLDIKIKEQFDSI